jgi:hypothetical protein
MNTSNFRFSSLGKIIPFVLLVQWVVGCSPSEDQLLFEQQAFSAPSGFTETNDRGIVVRQDPDDWRIGPMFYRLVTINPIYPNPTKGSDVRLQMYIERNEAVFGLEIVRIDTRYVPVRYIPLYRNTQAPLAPGIININIPFSIIFPQYPGLDERGLHRILVLDSRQNVISYGDLKLD